MLKGLEEIREANQEEGIRMLFEFLIPGQESKGTYKLATRFNPILLDDPQGLQYFIVWALESAVEKTSSPEEVCNETE